jgi:sirohydrochlorin ferrochelatase
LTVLDAKTGILLVGHGTRRPTGNRAFLDLCRAAAQRAGRAAVEPCFLEIAAPAIDRGLANLARRGVARLVVVPMQLTAGRHVRHDIPNQVRQAMKSLPRMSVVFANHLGSHAGLVDLAEERLKQAVGGRVPARCCALVLVARGSRDLAVRDEIVRLARLRRERNGTDEVYASFLAMCEPSFGEVVDHAAVANWERVVVQPHLLLPGQLTGRLEAGIRDMSAKFPQIEWITTSSLGPDARLADFGLDLAAAALRR